MEPLGDAEVGQLDVPERVTRMLAFQAAVGMRTHTARRRGSGALEELIPLVLHDVRELARCALAKEPRGIEASGASRRCLLSDRRQPGLATGVSLIMFLS